MMWIVCGEWAEHTQQLCTTKTWNIRENYESATDSQFEEKREDEVLRDSKNKPLNEFRQRGTDAEHSQSLSVQSWTSKYDQIWISAVLFLFSFFSFTLFNSRLPVKLSQREEKLHFNHLIGNKWTINASIVQWIKSKLFSTFYRILTSLSSLSASS